MADDQWAMINGGHFFSGKRPNFCGRAVNQTPVSGVSL